MIQFLTSNTTNAKLLRTIVQGILAILMQNLADYLNLLKLTPNTVALVTPLLMVILSALMSTIGDKATNNISNATEDDLPVQPSQETTDEASVLTTEYSDSNSYIERSASNVDGI